MSSSSISHATTFGPSGPGSDGNEEVQHVHQSSKTGASSSDSLSHLQHALAGVLILCRGAVDVYKIPKIATGILMCKLLIKVKNGDNILAEDFAMF